jgi:hypothetical protein
MTQALSAVKTSAAASLPRYLAMTGLATYPVHLASVRNRVLDHVDRDALPCFREVLAAIARALE